MSDDPGIGAQDLWRILARAVESNAMSVSFEPGSDSTTVRFRVDGQLRVHEDMPRPVWTRVFDHIQRLTDLEGRSGDGMIQPADKASGAWSVVQVAGRNGPRLSLKPYGRPNLVFDLDRLGLDQVQTGILRHAVHTERPGIVLVSGPTWSGKNTTIYSLLREWRERGMSVGTAEWEFRGELPGIHQALVDVAAGLNFDAFGKFYVRSDIDVIFLRDISDYSTASTAFDAVLNKSRRVITGVHCQGIADAAVRYVNMGIDPWIVGSAVSVLHAQRLLRQLCLRCRNAVKTPARALTDAGLDHDTLPTAQLFRPIGCPTCGGTGYRGMVVAAETYRVSEAFVAMLCDRAQSRDLAKLAASEGMRSQRQSALKLAVTGVTSLEEVLLRTPSDV